MNNVSIPAILTANTFYWSPCSSAGGRRSNETRRQSEVADFFKQLGFNVSHEGDNVIAESGEIYVKFHYSETCKNVYKSLEVYRGGKKSNISIIKKMLA